MNQRTNQGYTIIASISIPNQEYVLGEKQFKSREPQYVTWCCVNEHDYYYGHYITDKNVELVTKHGIFTEAEFRARNAIHLEAYTKIINIEAKTTLDMALRQIIPAVSRYCADLASNLCRKESVGCSVAAEKDLVRKLSQHTEKLYALCESLKNHLSNVPKAGMEAANYFSEIIVPEMDSVRKEADTLELLTDKAYWPFPTYSDLLFY